MIFSPNRPAGLTASLAIGDYVAEVLEKEND